MTSGGGPSWPAPITPTTTDMTIPLSTSLPRHSLCIFSGGRTGPSLQITSVTPRTDSNPEQQESHIQLTRAEAAQLIKELENFLDLTQS